MGELNPTLLDQQRRVDVDFELLRCRQGVPECVGRRDVERVVHHQDRAAGRSRVARLFGLGNDQRFLPGPRIVFGQRADSNQHHPLEECKVAPELTQK